VAPIPTPYSHLGQVYNPVTIGSYKRAPGEKDLDKMGYVNQHGLSRKVSPAAAYILLQAKCSPSLQGQMLALNPRPYQCLCCAASSPHTKHVTLSPRRPLACAPRQDTAEVRLS
jgi:hypothetical protein